MPKVDFNLYFVMYFFAKNTLQWWGMGGGSLKIHELASLSIFNPFQIDGILYTVKRGWSIIYIKGFQVIISKKVLHFYLRVSSQLK